MKHKSKSPSSKDASSLTQRHFPTVSILLVRHEKCSFTPGDRKCCRKCFIEIQDYLRRPIAASNQDALCCQYTNSPPSLHIHSSQDPKVMRNPHHHRPAVIRASPLFLQSIQTRKIAIQVLHRLPLVDTPQLIFRLHRLQSFLAFSEISQRCLRRRDFAPQNWRAGQCVAG